METRCLSCSSERSKAWYYQTKNAPAQKEKRAAYKSANKRLLKSGQLKHHYGLTIEEYDAMLSSQGHKCAICRRSAQEFTTALAVDHDHKTGKVRGLLCSNCNNGLGRFKDDPAVMSAAVAYLNKGKS